MVNPNEFKNEKEYIEQQLSGLQKQSIMMKVNLLMVNKSINYLQILLERAKNNG